MTPLNIKLLCGEIDGGVAPQLIPTPRPLATGDYGGRGSVIFPKWEDQATLCGVIMELGNLGCVVVDTGSTSPRWVSEGGRA